MKTVLVLILALLLVASPLIVYAGKNGAVEGEPLFRARCALCHQLPEPGMLTLRQWRRIITTMQKRMHQKGMLPLTADEQAEILAFLSSQAKQ